MNAAETGTRRALALLLDPVGKANLPDGDPIGLEAAPNQLAVDFEPCEIDPRWLITDQVE